MLETLYGTLQVLGIFTITFGIFAVVYGIRAAIKEAKKKP